ncbi:serine--tRNA ligase [Desulfobulbus oligotrophicus]|uniref:Serine--tRNA ligase n=1 Tax=Desulfobulbus oligotrophicus TaxID=1909699 RepID=A0A7T5VCT1_9BACT|nr:serine--tRNA ligase [Desulfobulbus oligotrophicus]QQG65509.1 serine--tRNA ligase [Desulfobulbus oligotrophicus]
MLELRFVREHLDLVRQKSMLRGVDPQLIDQFMLTDQRRLAALAEVEALKNRRNTVSKTIASLKQSGDHLQAEAMIVEMRAVSDHIKELDTSLVQIEEELQALVLSIPNLCDDTVPPGKSEQDNLEIKRWGTIPTFSFPPRPHWEIGELLGILDFETAAKLAGARFALLRGFGSRLSRALINLFLDLHTQRHGYTEVLPPFMVNTKTMTGTGQLPKFQEDLFKLDGWDLWLIPTAEVPVTNIHADTTLDEADLPLKYTAYTPCFRSEAGSYGKDTRGLIRQHQFEKVELVKFTTPEQSWHELEQLLADAEAVLQLLELPYRVVTLCTGDLGFSAAKTYDIEVWLPGQNCYREISSCSNFLDFQARRAGIRYRPKGEKKSRLVHTLNGSGLAVGRTLLAILENYQNPDGTVRLPPALEPYFTQRF